MAPWLSPRSRAQPRVRIPRAQSRGTRPRTLPVVPAGGVGGGLPAARHPTKSTPPQRSAYPGSTEPAVSRPLRAPAGPPRCRRSASAALRAGASPAAARPHPPASRISIGPGIQAPPPIAPPLRTRPPPLAKQGKSLLDLVPPAQAAGCGSHSPSQGRPGAPWGARGAQCPWKRALGKSPGHPGASGGVAVTNVSDSVLGT